MKNIEIFIDRVAKSTQANSKEIRLSITEAQMLSLEFTQILINSDFLQSKITMLQERIIHIFDVSTDKELNINQKLSLKKGKNNLEFKIRKRCIRPMDVSNSKDTRCLAVAIKNIKLVE